MLLKGTGIEPATFGTGIRRATIAPTLLRRYLLVCTSDYIEHSYAADTAKYGTPRPGIEPGSSA